jgi:hypothetical protein
MLDIHLTFYKYLSQRTVFLFKGGEEDEKQNFKARKKFYEMDDQRVKGRFCC